MAQKRVTLTDIAKELKVSVGLVSVVLAGKAKEQRISDTIAKKVIEKANEMGYKVNQMARGLRTGHSGIIGLIVADIANPYFGKMARYVENQAALLDYQIMIGSSDESVEKLEQLIELFQSRQVDGVIVVPVVGGDKIIENSQKRNFPMVLVDRYCSHANESFVCTDNFSAANKLTQLLLDNGYDKIAAFVYNTELSSYQDRIKGYKAALQSSNNTNEFVYEVSQAKFVTQLETSIKDAIIKGCKGFFFANNSLGLESLKILDKLNYQVAKDIGIVSFDNPDAFQLLKPGITCYEQPIEQMSKIAVNHLVEKISKQKQTSDDLKEFLSGKLIIRNSI